MKQIWRIYTTDIRNVVRHWAAIVIILGLTILPSLYAWFNIKASWDPYSNTKDVPIAVSNEDKGANLRGKDINIGKEVVDSLKENKNLGWKFVDEKQAIEGVKHGEYYASITIPKDFSEKIATVLNEDQQKPELQYYVNEKVNAIAPKITAKGASGMVEEISKNFVKTANGEIFKVFNELGIDLETNLPSIEKVKDLIFKLEAQFPEINKAVDTALTDAETAQGLVKTAQDTLPTVENVIRNGQEMTKDLDTFFVQNAEVFAEAPETIKTDLQRLQLAMNGVAQITDFLKNPSMSIDFAKLNQESLTNASQTLKQNLESLRQIGVNTQELTSLIKSKNVDFDKMKSSLERINKLSGSGLKIIDGSIQFLTSLNQGRDVAVINDMIKSLEGQKVKLQNINDQSSKALEIMKGGAQPAEDLLNNLDAVATSSVAGLDKILGNYSSFDSKLQELGQSKQINMDSSKDALNTLNDRFNTGIQIINSMLLVLNDVNSLTGENKTGNVINQLNGIKGKLQEGVNVTSKALDAINKGQKPAEDIINNINAISKDVSERIGTVNSKYDSEIVPSFNRAIERTKQMSKDTSKILSEANKSLPDVKKLLEDASKGLALGTDKVAKIKEELPEAEKKVKEIADKIREFESQEDLKEIIRLLKNDVEKQSDYFANPVNLKENKLFPIPNYGSAMSPFYTVLALWVGALLMVSLLTVEVHEEDAEYRSYHVYFGRFLTFLTIGLAQAFIVSMGDMFLLGTYVVDKFWFVLFSLLIGGIFVCIVYSLVSVFGNIGKSMAIILLVLQVAGSGGTFPVQMTPKFFQMIYPFLPFTYAISIIRETVGGMLWDIVWRDLFALCVWVIVMLIMALLLKKPLNKSSEKFVENAKGSKLIH